MTTVRPRARLLLAATVLAAATIALAACVPEPTTTETPSASPSVSASGSASPSTPSAEPSPTGSDRPQALEIALPGSCDALYSASMRAALDADVAPLNGSGVTFASTRIAAAADLIDSGAPTRHCTWGTGAATSISTTVTILAPEDVPRVQDTLAANGLVCSDLAGGILCAGEKDGGSGQGEAHFLRGNGWVSTAWLGTLPTGYTEDVAKTLWG